jgi:hypothetical protein
MRTQSTTTRTRTRKTPAPTLPTLTTISTLNHDAIAHRAYELFLSSGARHGCDVEHWLQAESELRERSLSAGH